MFQSSSGKITTQMMGVGEQSAGREEVQILGDSNAKLTPVLGRSG